MGGFETFTINSLIYRGLMGILKRLPYLKRWKSHHCPLILHKVLLIKTQFTFYTLLISTIRSNIQWFKTLLTLLTF
ncbi:hypothetical protein Hanom_Chr00s004470g01722801 [Helianthus anomalus]